MHPFPLTDTFSVISESDEQSHMDEVFEAFISSDNLDMKFEVKIGVNILPPSRTLGLPFYSGNLKLRGGEGRGYFIPF